MTWRPDELAELDDVFAEFEVEDRACNYLADFPAQTALAIAIAAARWENLRWGDEKTKMFERDDPRPVYKIHPNELEILDANTSPHIASNFRAEVFLLSIFARLPPDAAARVSILVVRWIVRRVAIGR